MSTSKPKDEKEFDLEQQFILRMPEDAARYLAEDIDLGVAFRDNFTMELKQDHRHCIIRYNGQVYQGRIMDLPCIIESHKTTDKKNFYQTASISQMIICTQGDDGVAPIRGSAAYAPPKDVASVAGSQSTSAQPAPTSSVNEKDPRLYHYLHGITPPLKNALRRRFRKTRKKKAVDLSQVEQEVKNMLKNDLRADDVTWEISWNDASEQQHQQTTKQSPAGAGGGDEAADGDSGAARDALQGEEGSGLKSTSSSLNSGLSPALTGGGQGGHRHLVATDELFGAVSSSSSNSSSINSSSAEEEEEYDVEEGEGADVSKEDAVRIAAALALSLDTSSRMEEADVAGMNVDDHQIENVVEVAADEQMKTALLLSDSDSTAGDDEFDDYPGIRNALSPQELADRYQRQFHAQQEANDEATATAAAEIEEELNVEEDVDDNYEEACAMVPHRHNHSGSHYDAGGMDVMMLDEVDEDDDFVPAGGELLADDESVVIFQQQQQQQQQRRLDTTPFDSIAVPYQHPGTAENVFGRLSEGDDDDEDDERSQLF